ncbi:MAG: hypothetical protein LUQ38_05555 [Methanotrichaceae archaeon]|nr:hypothetical protein [Methanotrichaceae archaeon]
MRRNWVPPIIICLFLLLAGLLSSNTLAQASNGSLEIQIVAGNPKVFTSSPLANGKYPASHAAVLIYRTDLNFSYKGSADGLGKLIVRDLPVGLNNYEISWRDFRKDMWGAKGSVFIEKGSREKELVELKRVFKAG